MKLKNLIWMFLAFSFFLSQFSYSADEFLNGNKECESENIVSNGYSVACKNYYSSLTNVVSFSGGTYPDCAVAASTTIAGENNVSVFLNKGTGATACPAVGSGDQFNSSANYAFSGITTTTYIGTMTVGTLSGDQFSDIAVLNASNTDVDTANSTGATGSFGASPVATSNVNWQTAAGQVGATSSSFERSAALLDCNNDGDLDEAVLFGGTNGAFTIGFNVVINNGGFQPLLNKGPFGNTSATATPVAGGGGSSLGALTVNDFNEDGYLDVAYTTPNAFPNKIVVCLNDPNNLCDFSNCSTKDITEYADTPSPTSIVSGDFDGDGNSDIAINAPGFSSKSIVYYFGNGSGGFNATQAEAVVGTADSSPVVLTTGCFNEDNIVDIAASVTTAPSGPSGKVVLFELNSARVATKLNLNFSSRTRPLAGIDAADFDRNGRDDIIVVGTDSTTSQRRAYVFMNSLGAGLSTAVAQILTPNTVAKVGTPVQLQGQCTMTDGSVSDFTYQWTYSSPDGGVGTFSNGNIVNPAFTATQAGTFNFQFTCTTICGSVAASIGPRSTTPTPTPTNPNNRFQVFVYPASDQGGCVSNSLSPLSGSMNMNGLLPLLAPAGIWLVRRRKAQERRENRLKRIFLFLSMFLLFGMMSKFSQATTSFQTNFFKPVIDDSEYFTVYSSPLMKKSYYHTGFYIDYAHHPYEFGDSNFNRTNGAVNHLLTGNFVGSYAIFDWLNAGGRLPVYFWDGIRAPLLNRPNENNLDLGDLGLELKFKLVDQKAHGVGWSLIPFMTVPSATHAVRDFTGAGTLTGGVKTVIDGKPHDRVSMSLNVGYEARDNVITPGGNRIDDHFLLGAGISGDAIKEKLKVIAETQVETVTKDFFSKRRTTPAEGRLGFRYMFKNGVDINAGGGMGYTNGIASPDFRAFAGVTYTKRPIAKVAIKEDVGEVGIGDELKLADKIYFEFDKAVVRSISQPTLDKAAAFIKAHPEIKKLRIEGHTCDLGTVPYNQKLSERRANAVVDYLVGQGISRSILHPVGYGELQPAVPNTDESHREQNRRVQFFVEEK